MDIPFFLLSIIPILCVSIGIPLLVIGLNSMKNKVMSGFTILPLFSTQTFPRDIYYISKKADNGDLSKFINITLEYGKDDIKKREIFLMHNMWGFNISANLIINYKKIRQNNISQNNNFSAKYEPLVRHSIYELPKLRSSFEAIQYSDNIFPVTCLFPSESIPSICDYSKHPMLINGNYSLNNLFPSIDNGNYNSITIEFLDSYLIPYNYVDAPEAYLVFINYKEKKSMRIAGIVLSTIGIIISFIYFIIICLAVCC